MKITAEEGGRGRGRVGTIGSNPVLPLHEGSGGVVSAAKYTNYLWLSVRKSEVESNKVWCDTLICTHLAIHRRMVLNQRLSFSTDLEDFQEFIREAA